MEFIKPPKYVGHYQIGGRDGLRVSMTTRPRWLTRLMVRWLLEWYWRDEEK